MKQKGSRKRVAIVAALRILGAVVACLVALWIIVAQPSPVRAVEVAPQASADVLRSHVSRIVTEFTPRTFEHMENLDACAAYIEAEFRKSGAVVERQEFRIHERSYRNVVCHMGPTNGPRVIVGAHYDSFESTPGADDNASGVAGLLELSRILTDSPPRHRIELVAFTLEEPPYFRSPFMGSAQHASRTADAGTDVAYMVALEMLGYYDDRAGSQKYPLPALHLMYPPQGDFIALVGSLAERELIAALKAEMQGATPLPVQSICAPRDLPGVDFSDHASYWDKGFPAVMVTDTAFYRNEHYHGPGDTPDTLDYARMTHAVDAVHAMITAPLATR